MTDRIDFGGEPWQAIPHRILRDVRLSPAAKGGLVTLLSHEEGWVRSCIATLQRESRIGRAGARSIMRELVGLGYARLEQVRRTDGRFGTAYTVYAIPQVQAAEPVISPGAVPRGAVAPGAAHTPAVVEALVVEPLDEESQEQDQQLALASRTRARDEVFEALCNIEGHGWDDLNSTERGKLNKATRLAKESRASPEQIRLAADRWPDVMGDATLTAIGVMSNFHRLLTGPARARRQAAELPMDRITREALERINANGRSARVSRRVAGELPG